MGCWESEANRGMYRLRYAGEPVHLPVELKARKGGGTDVYRACRCRVGDGIEKTIS